MKYVYGILGLILAAILIIAIVPEKDCAGHNTWRTAEVCHNGK